MQQKFNSPTLDINLCKALLWSGILAVLKERKVVVYCLLAGNPVRQHS